MSTTIGKPVTLGTSPRTYRDITNAELLAACLAAGLTVFSSGVDSNFTVAQSMVGLNILAPGRIDSPDGDLFISAFGGSGLIILGGSVVPLQADTFNLGDATYKWVNFYCQSISAQGANLGFYGAAPVAKQTGVAVNAAAIHAAGVALGLWTA